MYAEVNKQKMQLLNILFIKIVSNNYPFNQTIKHTVLTLLSQCKENIFKYTCIYHKNKNLPVICNHHMGSVSSIIHLLQDNATRTVYPFNQTIDNAVWVGLEKTNDIAYYLRVRLNCWFENAQFVCKNIIMLKSH